jgi:hypothetical protein
MCRMESSLTLPRVVRGAEKLRSGYEVVGLQPTGHGSPGRAGLAVLVGGQSVRLSARLLNERASILSQRVIHPPMG